MGCGLPHTFFLPSFLPSPPLPPTFPLPSSLPSLPPFSSYPISFLMSFSLLHPHPSHAPHSSFLLFPFSPSLLSFFPSSFLSPPSSSLPLHHSVILSLSLWSPILSTSNPFPPLPHSTFSPLGKSTSLAPLPCPVPRPSSPLGSRLQSILELTTREKSRRVSRSSRMLLVLVVMRSMYNRSRGWYT